MDADSSAKDEKQTMDDDDDNKRVTEEPKSFPLLNALSDLLMLPKDMLMDRTIRMEVSPRHLFFFFPLASCLNSSYLYLDPMSFVVGVSINQSPIG